MSASADAQDRAWRSLIGAALVLEGALDRQSQRDAGMPHTYYQVLVMLFESPGRQLQMSILAGRLRYSLSRLAHAVTSMEKSGWLERTRSALDGRVQNVGLTDAGIRLVRKVSPIQSREVRARALSGLTPEQVVQLEQLMGALTTALTAADPTGRGVE